MVITDFVSWLNVFAALPELDTGKACALVDYSDYMIRSSIIVSSLTTLIEPDRVPQSLVNMRTCLLSAYFMISACFLPVTDHCLLSACA